MSIACTLRFWAVVGRLQQQQQQQQQQRLPTACPPFTGQERPTTAPAAAAEVAAAANDAVVHMCLPVCLPVQVVVAALGIVICYADRSNMSTAILPMSEAFGWDKVCDQGGGLCWQHCCSGK
jgi:hypothetical protein